MQNNTPDPPVFQQKIDSPFNISGRFSRLSYLAWSFLTSLITSVILSMFMGSIFSALYSAAPIADTTFLSLNVLIGVILLIVMTVISIIFTIRRLHDMDKTGWLALLMIVPLINIIFYLFILLGRGTSGTNRFGAPRHTRAWEKVTAWAYILISALILLLSIAGIFYFPQKSDEYLQPTLHQYIQTSIRTEMIELNE